MSRVFKLIKDPYNDKEKIFTKNEVTIEPGVTVLVGCNGTGKTTLIHQIISQLDDEGIPYLTYDNLSDGGTNAKSKSVFYNDLNTLSSLMSSSEGEQIFTNICNITRKIGNFVRQNKDKPELWFLFDAIDSGLSIDNTQDIKNNLFKLIIDDNPNTDIYIIVSANSYEMCRNEQCLDVRNCEYVTFKTYNSYSRFILKSRKMKDKRVK